MSKIIALDVFDLRFPVGMPSGGAEAALPQREDSAIYLVLRTDDPSGLAGHALIPAGGASNPLQIAAIRALSLQIVGCDTDTVIDDLGGFARRLTTDPQYDWQQPKAGVERMAAAGVINAAWDLAARRAGKPLWRFIAEMPAERLVAQLDFRYVTDVLTSSEAQRMLRRAEWGKMERIDELTERGYPAYATLPDSHHLSRDEFVRQIRHVVLSGFHLLKLKVGIDVAEDVRRCRIARQALGPEIALALDADQRWDAAKAIHWMKQLAPYGIAWVEAPTSAEDIHAHALIRRRVGVPVSAGSYIQSRVLFKQLFQAHAVNLIQLDVVRAGGVGEALVILLMAARLGVRVFPCAGGVGLSELGLHLAIADFVGITGKMDDRAIEFADRQHEHFASPLRLRWGRCQIPTGAGASMELHTNSVREHVLSQWTSVGGAATPAHARGFDHPGMPA